MARDEKSKRRASNRKIRKHAKAKALKPVIENLRRLTALSRELDLAIHRALAAIDPDHMFTDPEEDF